MLGSGRLPNTPIAVDYFRFQPSVRAYFMSHMHTDHNDGLSPSWNAGPIYCSHITRNLLLAKFNIKPSLVHALEVGVTSMVVLKNDVFVNVTLIDANHCPGAVMFLFEGYFGTILHTGDFRYTPAMFNDGALKKHVVDHLFMDNTFCHPIFQMPPREDALQQIIEIITLHPNHRVVIGTDGLGKEDMLVILAHHFKTLVVVSEERYCTIRLLEDVPMEVFTHQKDMGFIHTWPRTKITFRQVKEWNKEEPTIAIIPTGWTYKPYTSHNRSLGIPKKQSQTNFDEDTEFNKQKDDKHEKEKEKEKDKEKKDSVSQDTQTLSVAPTFFPSQHFSLHSSTSSSSNVTQTVSPPSNPPLFSPSTQVETLAPHQPESYEFEPLDSQSSIFQNIPPPSPPSPSSSSDSTQAFTSSQLNDLKRDTSNLSDSSSFIAPNLTTGQTTQNIFVSQTQPTQSLISSFDTLDPHQPQSHLFTESTSMPPQNSSTSLSKNDSVDFDKTETIRREDSNAQPELTQQISFTYTQPTQSPPSSQGTMDPHQPSLDFGEYSADNDYEAEKDNKAESEKIEEDKMDVDEEEKKDEDSQQGEDVQKEEVKIENTRGDTNGNKLIFWVPYSLHSSFLELSEFVKRLRPRQITPLVHNKFDPRTYFKKFLDTSPGADYTINPILLFNQELVQEASLRTLSPAPSLTSSTLSMSSFHKPIPSNKEIKARLNSMKLSHPGQITPDPSIPIPPISDAPKKTPKTSPATSKKVSPSKEMTEEEKIEKAKEAADKNSETLRKLQKMMETSKPKLSEDEDATQEEGKTTDNQKGKAKEKSKEKEKTKEKEKEKEKEKAKAKEKEKGKKPVKEVSKKQEESKKKDTKDSKNKKESKELKESEVSEVSEVSEEVKKSKSPKSQPPSTLSPKRQSPPPRRQSPRTKKRKPQSNVLEDYFAVVDTPTKRKRNDNTTKDIDEEEEEEKDKNDDEDWTMKSKDQKNKTPEKGKEKDTEKQKQKKAKASPKQDTSKNSDARQQNSDFLANVLKKKASKSKT